MKFVRQQDIIASMEMDSTAPRLPLYQGRRYLVGASMRIGILCLTICLLIAVSF